MKKYWWVIIAFVALVLLLILMRANEDDWIKDSSGVYVKHGNPKNIPQEVLDQQKLISQARQKLIGLKESKQDISSGPCLGLISDDWVADLVHNPRTSVDDQAANQCPDYISGKAHHFIELNLANGEVVRIK